MVIITNLNTKTYDFYLTKLYSKYELTLFFIFLYLILIITYELFIFKFNIFINKITILFYNNLIISSIYITRAPFFIMII